MVSIVFNLGLGFGHVHVHMSHFYAFFLQPLVLGVVHLMYVQVHGGYRSFNATMASHIRRPNLEGSSNINELCIQNNLPEELSGKQACTRNGM